MITSLNIRCVSSHGLCSLCSLFDTMIPPLDYVPGNNLKKPVSGRFCFKPFQ